MSEAQRKLDEKVVTESGEYEVRLAHTSDPNIFTNITNKVSTGLEQIAGFIHEKAANLKPGEKSSTLTEYGQKTANALHSSANYLKQADFDQMQSDLRTTIKRNPERSLLVSLGVGILIGAILRKKR